MPRRQYSEPEMVDFTGTVLVNTGRAILVYDPDLMDQDDAVWLPLSQVERYDGETGEGCSFTLPGWLAEDRGLI